MDACKTYAAPIGTSSDEPDPRDVVFVKLGGSVITDKTEADTVRGEVLSRLAAEISAAIAQRSVARLIVGHGSGSFGHWAARPYGTRQGVATVHEWRGFAKVAAAAARLNRKVTDSLLEAGVPVLSLQPSGSARCEDGTLQYLDTHPIRAALARGIVPLVYGDVAFDRVRGGTIISTEDIFVYLSDHVPPTRILLVGDVPGVLDAEGRVIPRITAADLPQLRNALRGASGVDVTGGMADKVARMVELVENHPATTVHLLSGMVAGLLSKALADPTVPAGTRIAARGT